MQSIEELEVALDAMEGIAEDGGELDPTNVSREARLRVAYMDWCKEYGKESDEVRFQTFTSNYLAMEEYAKENGKAMQLNMYADCTEEEYIALNSGLNDAAVEVVSEPEVDTEAQAKAEEEAKKAAEKAKVKAETQAEEATLKAEKQAEEAKAKKEVEAKVAAENAAAKKAAEEAETKKLAELEAAKEAGEFMFTSVKDFAEISFLVSLIFEN